MPFLRIVRQRPGAAADRWQLRFERLPLGLRRFARCYATRFTN